MRHNFSFYSCLYLMAKRLLLFVVSDKICFIFLFFLPHIECTVKFGLTLYQFFCCIQVSAIISVNVSC